MLYWILFALLIIRAFLYRHPHFVQDVNYMRQKLKIRNAIRKYVQQNVLILDRFSELVQSQPHKPLLLFQNETFTYQEADELINKAARVLLQTGLKQGDTVALFFRNEPMFVWLWFGLMKIGCAAAFLNYNIRSRSLLHCMSCCGAKTLVAAGELEEAVEEVLPGLLEQQVKVFTMADKGRTADVQSLRDRMRQASSEPLSKDVRSQVTIRSPATYIYTSGTTGLPKAAVVNHVKMWNMSHLLITSGLNPEDVVYCSLPLYHSSGMLGFTGALVKGATVALRGKFSASQFWDDCRKYNATVIQYIGETMRYICSTPAKPNDRSHKVRLAVGNGIRADVWRDFVTRFGDIDIREFYGATEGNLSFVNYSNKMGAVGRDTFLNRYFFPYALIKFNVDEGKPVRDSSGFCIQVDKGEPGLMVAKITLMTPFTGYAGDLEQTEKKRLHDVFEKGDVYFNTGDLLLYDEDNFLYFHDRVGDTFRWKGENVATTEVADVITLADCIKEANVYGVVVPGQEGRAGMAAVILAEGKTFDSASLYKHVENLLPSYARPRFIRIQESMQITGTFKHTKVTLVEEGFNPHKITDPLYFLDEKRKDYVPLTLDLFNSVSTGELKI